MLCTEVHNLPINYGNKLNTTEHLLCNELHINNNNYDSVSPLDQPELV